MPDLESIMEALEETSEAYADELPPDGDWDPMLVVTVGETGNIVHFEMPKEDWKKDDLFERILPNLIHEQFGDPDSIIFVSSTWWTEWQEGDPRPRENPDRKEALLLQGISRDEELMSMAEIIRSESHPELEWIMQREYFDMSGRFGAFLRRAMWT